MDWKDTAPDEHPARPRRRHRIPRRRLVPRARAPVLGLVGGQPDHRGQRVVGFVGQRVPGCCRATTTSSTTSTPPWSRSSGAILDRRLRVVRLRAMDGRFALSRSQALALAPGVNEAISATRVVPATAAMLVKDENLRHGRGSMENAHRDAATRRTCRGHRVEAVSAGSRSPSCCPASPPRRPPGAAAKNRGLPRPPASRRRPCSSPSCRDRASPIPSRSRSGCAAKGSTPSRTSRRAASRAARSSTRTSRASWAKRASIRRCSSAARSTSRSASSPTPCSSSTPGCSTTTESGESASPDTPKAVRTFRTRRYTRRSRGRTHSRSGPAPPCTSLPSSASRPLP